MYEFSVGQLIDIIDRDRPMVYFSIKLADEVTMVESREGLRILRKLPSDLPVRATKMVDAWLIHGSAEEELRPKASWDINPWAVLSLVAVLFGWIVGRFFY